MGLFDIFKKKSNKEVEEKPIEDKALVILIDNPKAGMVAYFNSIGIKIRALYSSIDELKIDLLFDNTSTRVVIADSGVGKFKEDKESNSLHDLLEIIKNNNSSLSVISYSDTISKNIRNIVKRMEKNSKQDNDKIDVDYSTYSNIRDIIDTLSKYRENYVVDGAEDIIYIEPLKFKGIESEFDNSSDVSFNDFDVIRGLADNSNGDSIKAYNVRI